ncbi:MAG: DUF4440 domain-containing protein [Phycisphaeraceae bacterium]|nr:DUF4440 domain-containing protein [Phycisphaeraceae bacterium]
MLDRWLEAANAADVETLIGLYHEEAVLVPTFRDRILNTPDLIRDYFDGIRNLEQLSVDLAESSLNIQSAGNDLFILSGNYRWRWVAKDQRIQRYARFSYVLNTTESKPILHHHSSDVPTV